MILWSNSVSVNLSNNSVEGINSEDMVSRAYNLEDLKTMILNSFEDEGYSADDRLFLDKLSFKRNLSNFAQKRLEEKIEL